MSALTTRRRGIVTGTIAVAALTVLAACAPTPEATPTPPASPSAEPTAPEPYAGPIAFVGDELSWLLPSADDLTTLIPSATDVSAPSDRLEQISDGGGPEFAPAICGILYMEQSIGSVGTRIMSWSLPGDTDYTVNSVTAMQFASDTQATFRMDQIERAAQECAQFDFGGPETFDAVVADEDDGVRAVAGTLNAEESSPGWRSFHAFASVGNSLVHLMTSLPADAPIDASAAAELLQKTAVQAKAELVESLTSAPPAGAEEPAGDAASPWGDWTITGLGVGPIRLSDTLDDVSAALPDAALTPSRGPRSTVVTSADGVSSLLVDMEDDGTISGITAGGVSDEEDRGVDGADAPSAFGVRIGDPVSAAIAAAPGGTRIHVSSSGQWGYMVADRDGHRLIFHTTREDTDSPEARIIGISLTDMAAWGDLSVE